MAVSEQAVVWLEEQLAAAQVETRPTRRVRKAYRMAPQEWRSAVSALGVISLVAIATVGASVRVAELGYAVDQAQANAATVALQNAALRDTLASLENPATIHREAIAELGLQRPAGYVPIPVFAVAPVAKVGPGSEAMLRVPAFSGPAPGGLSATWHRASTWVRSAYRSVLG